MIKVLEPGLFSTIQDLGRLHSRNYGIPVAGVMDSQSAKLANLIVGNDEHMAVMEITLQGPVLQFLENTHMSLTGAQLSPTLNRVPVSLNQTYAVKRGDILQFGKRQQGVRCYLAVVGGFDTPLYFGSRSYYKGITSQDKIIRGDALPIGHQENVSTSKIELNSIQFDNKLKVNPGPEFDQLKTSQQAQLKNSTFTIGLNNRMAYQIEEHFPNDLPSILSSAVQPGTVQLTPSGKLIILMRDCQTTGGYPRVLQLSEEAICFLSQKMNGDKIGFRLVDA